MNRAMAKPILPNKTTGSHHVNTVSSKNMNIAGLGTGVNSNMTGITINRTQETFIRAIELS